MELPAHMQVQPEDSAMVAGLKERLAKTYTRISKNVQAEEDMRREKELALAWCRQNGNPHLTHAPRQ